MRLVRLVKTNKLQAGKNMQKMHLFLSSQIKPQYYIMRREVGVVLEITV